MNCSRRFATGRAGWLAGAVVWAAALTGVAQNPIHVTYLWHMHQPIYYPRMGVTEIDNAGLFSRRARISPTRTWAMRGARTATRCGIPISSVWTRTAPHRVSV